LPIMPIIRRHEADLAMQMLGVVWGKLKKSDTNVNYPI
jgi:hypothetical protein